MNVLDDVTGDALIHIIMKKTKHDLRLDFLLTLLIHSNVDVNLRNKKGIAALHMAVEVSSSYLHFSPSLGFGVVDLTGASAFYAI